MIEAVITDIEGTVGALDFVQRVLFPYSAERMEAFLRDHGRDPEVVPHLERLSAQEGYAIDDWAGLAELLRGWIAEDRKDTSLKAMQGLIWERAFRAGEFKAHLYPDALRALQSWHAQGIPLYVYSSGSVHAQKLYFAHTEYGDLSHLFQGYFDTTVGPKRAADSYRSIARNIGRAPTRIAFLSDVSAELDAAHAAGMATWLVVRQARADTRLEHHKVVTSFAEIDLRDR